jgi:hypothetical protein
VSFWFELGFRDSPYATVPVPADAYGERMLVGRSAEIDALVNTISSTTTHAMVNGINGVGKSSLIAVASYRLRLGRGPSGPTALFLPLRHSINITKQSTSDSVRTDLVLALAQALVDYHDTLQDAGRPVPVVTDLERWLNAPLLRSHGGGASALGFGGNATRSLSVNAGEGFSRLGLANLVLEAVAACSPPDVGGGFVVTLENLELAGGPTEIRGLLEACRDPLLTTRGVRWIICGASPALRQMSNSRRLDGIVGRPITVQPLPEDLVGDVIEARVESYRTRTDPLVPVDGTCFTYLFNVARGNLRTALRYSEEYSVWAYQRDALADDDDERRAQVVAWLRARAEAEVAAASQVPMAAWLIFDQIVDTGGTLAVDMARQRELNSLEEHGLIGRTLTPTSDGFDCELTQAGWLANVARQAP